MRKEHVLEQLKEMLPLLPEGWRLELYNNGDDWYSIQLYCYSDYRELCGTERIIETVEELQEVLDGR
jgi:hypothetical protein